MPANNQKSRSAATRPDGLEREKRRVGHDGHLAIEAKPRRSSPHHRRGTSSEGKRHWGSERRRYLDASHLRLHDADSLQSDWRHRRARVARPIGQPDIHPFRDPVNGWGRTPDRRGTRRPRSSTWCTARLARRADPRPSVVSRPFRRRRSSCVDEDVPPTGMDPCLR
jgi:hypothetical protein